MFDEGANDGARSLGPQGQASTAAVLERVHLLLDDVGRLADSREHLVVLEHRRDVQAVAGSSHLLREHADERGPPCRFRREDVVGALGCSELVGVGDEIGR